MFGMLVYAKPQQSASELRRPTSEVVMILTELTDCLPQLRKT